MHINKQRGYSLQFSAGLKLISAAVDNRLRTDAASIITTHSSPRRRHYVFDRSVRLSVRAGMPGGAELSVGPFCVTRSNPTYQLTDPTQPNPLKVEKNWTQPDTANSGAYSLVVTYFYTHNLSRTFSQPSHKIKFNSLVQPNLI